MFYILLLYVHSCFAIILMGKRERAGCSAEFVFLGSHACCVAIPLSAMGLPAFCDCDISRSYSLTNFGCHSCEQRRLWRVSTFAWSSLSLRHSSKFLCGGPNGD